MKRTVQKDLRTHFAQHPGWKKQLPTSTSTARTRMKMSLHYYY